MLNVSLLALLPAVAGWKLYGLPALTLSTGVPVRVSVV